MTRIAPIELHLHLEGAVTPQRLLSLADRHGQPGAAAAVLTPEGGYRRGGDFAGFLEIFKALTLLLRTPADYHAVALDLGRALRDQGVQYAEVIVAYGVMRKREIDPLPVQRALHEAAGEIREGGGPILSWLPDSTRQFGPDAAWRDLEAALKAGRELGVAGYGLGGDEAALPLADFAEHFREARAEGLGTTVHAGEVCGPASVRDAVEVAGVDRIGHATAAASDPTLMALLRDREIFCELCPGSNVATGAVPDLAAHPLRAFLDAGVPCCLNTDDPAVFGLDLAGEYAAGRRHHALSDAEIDGMAAQARAAAFTDF